MKLSILIFLLLLDLKCNAQFVLVNFFPDNQPAFGMTNYPTESSNTVSTNMVSGWSTNITVAQYLQLESQSIIFVNSQQASSQSNLFAFLTGYTNIGAGIIDTSNRINVMSNLWQSIKSGTNSQAQLTTIQSTMAQYDYINWVYMNNLVTLLQWLFPALQQIYQPQNDPLGH